MRILIFTFLLIICADAHTQTDHKIDLTDYLKEIQIWHKQTNSMSLSFWIPTSYWKIALADSPQGSPEVIAEIENAFENYVLVCALDFDINLDGSMRYTEEQELRKSISIIDHNGKSHFALPNDQLSLEALAYSEPIKPMFSEMLGKIGEGMNIYFFSVKNEDGENLVNEFEKGKFTVIHSNKEFEYALPLSILLPPKKCPVDGATMKGNWSFCPMHGSKLEK